MAIHSPTPHDLLSTRGFTTVDPERQGMLPSMMKPSAVSPIRTVRPLGTAPATGSPFASRVSGIRSASHLAP